MEIYKVLSHTNNISESKVVYFVPDATTQAQGQSLNLPDTVWNIGTLSDANALLLISQQEMLNHCADRFTVCHVTINDDGTQTWRNCDLSQEQPNTDQHYQILNVLNSDHTEVIGLDAAKAQFELNQQTFLEWSGLSAVTTLTELPQAPKPVV